MGAQRGKEVCTGLCSLLRVNGKHLSQVPLLLLHTRLHTAASQARSARTASNLQPALHLNTWQVYKPMLALDAKVAAADAAAAAAGGAGGGEGGTLVARAPHNIRQPRLKRLPDEVQVRRRAGVRGEVQ